MNEERKLSRIPQEENRRIISHNIPISLISPKLHREPSWISCTIMTSALASHSRKSDSDRTLLALLEQVCHRQVFNWVGGLVDAMSAGSFGVDDALWDTLAVEV